MAEVTITVDGHAHDAAHIKTLKANILLIKAGGGFLGCGYFDLTAAERLQEPVAIVTGVKNFDDMLAAKVVRLSTTAKAAGVTEGMTGREALAVLRATAV